MADLPLFIVLAAALIAGFGGFVKGTVGFAMPMIMITGIASFLPVETALAALILPTLIGNLWQSLRQGWRMALESIIRFRLYLSLMLGFLIFSAQLIRVLPQSALFLLIGIPVVFFTIIQLVGWEFQIQGKRRTLAEIFIGAGAGFIGGLSGVWGPPLNVYLTAIGTAKSEQMRVQGVVFGLGAVALTAAHVKSGVLNSATLPFSAAMVVPALLGLGIGFWVHDRLPQARFRKITLLVLALAGLNLIRRGLMG